MTFGEIFEALKKHDFVRRQSWAEHVFIQYRYTAPLIRMVRLASGAEEDRDLPVINTLDNNYRVTADDLFATDWINIDNC